MSRKLHNPPFWISKSGYMFHHASCFQVLTDSVAPTHRQEGPHMSDLIIMASLLLNDIQFSIMEYASSLGLLPLRFLLLVHHDSFTWLLLLLVHHTAVASPREFYTVPAARCWIIALLIGLPRNIFSWPVWFSMLTT